MPNPFYATFAATIACFAVAYYCILAERKSRKWYTDRFLLSCAGFFTALGLVGCVACLRLILS